ncbi:TonB-dependent receptor SusC, partial [termite gut metagenome]
KEITAAANLSIVLEEDINILESVVVIGYGTLDKRQLTSSITSISARELPQGVGGATIGNAMKGKVNSLIIQETPSPNSETTLQLRGMASVNTSRAPLVVIDGMPGGDIRSVVQEDIQSIDILKDASAGAIYGTRATGGVILITTKQAQEGKMRLSYTGEAIFKQNFGKPRVLTADEFRKYKPGVNDFGASVDWWDEGMSDNPTSQRHVLTMQGGARTAKIYASVMYEDNRGVLMGDTRKDVGGRINGSFKLVDGWIDINPHIDYRKTNRDQSKPGIGSLFANNPTRSPYDSSKWNPLGGGLDDQNVIIDAGLNTDEGLDTWFRPDVELILNILPVKGLTFHQTFGYEHRQWEWHNYQPSNSTLTEGNNRTGKGTAELKFDKTELFNSDGYFSFASNLGEDHYLNAAVGYSYFEQNGEMFRLKNYGFAVDGVKMWDIGKGTNLNNPNASILAEMESSKQISQKLFAFFGRANYSLKDKYLAAATLRHEGSSKFAVNKRWGDFWQLSGAWRISKENFMQNVSWLDDLKVRVAYGVTGNEGFSADYAATMYGADSYWMLPTGSWAYSYGITKNINPDLGWEEKHEWNVGVDYELFNRRIFGKIDFYRRNVEGLIYEVDVPQPPYTQSKMYKNIGTLKNTGWEFEIGSTIVDTKEWNYTTKLILSNNSTEVGSLWGDQTYQEEAYVGRAGNIHRIQENTKVGSFFLYKYAGLDDQGRFQAYGKDGKIIVPEIDGRSPEDKQFMGNYMPTVTAGWSHNLTYKNWSLGMTLTSWIDFDIYNELEHTQGTVAGVPAAARNLLLDAFTKNSAIKGQTLESDFFLQDGTFLKIQNLTLGYKFNTEKYLKVMESARLYLTMNNLYTFTKYKGLNPEVDITGWAGGIEWASIYPQTRSFALGLQLNF